MRKKFHILLGIVLLSVGNLLSSCGERVDAFDVDILRPVQSDDLEQLTYTVRVKGSGMCDLRDAKVKVTIPIALTSESAAGLHMEQEHEMGRVRRDTNKSMEFVVLTFGRLVDLESIEVDSLGGSKFDNCRMMRI